MMNNEQYNRIARVLPILKHADAQLVCEFQQAANFTRIPAGRDLFLEGDRVDGIALLVSGVVRVYKIGETGREITLYRFGLGESCILTANAILNQENFPAIASVEKEAEAVMIPAQTFREWVRRYDLWRDFVFELLSQRLSSVIMIVDEIAFRRMDVRVASLLLNRSQVQNPIHMTHQEIASELGSSREVISRLLEDFSEQGNIRIAAGIALIAWGLLGLTGTTGIIVIVVGLVPLAAGLLDFCVFAPLFGCPVSGTKVRAGK
jgi:CRP/FNR family transcriptional regulator, anaerobic regulatory protein